jgi:hypothetical protein
MPPNAVTRFLLWASVVIAVVGALDAGFDRDADLAVLFTGLAVLAAIQLLRLHVWRPAVPLRGDLVRWLTERSRISGEPVEHLADRAIASYRASLGDVAVDPARSEADEGAGEADRR